MGPNNNVVAVVGATGVTGGYTFDAAEAMGLSPLALGRDKARLTAFLDRRGLGHDRLRIVDITDKADLRRAFDGVGTVISTVAPFADHGIAIARAAAEMGLGYTDPSGEVGFIQTVIDTLDPIASQSGATLCTGNGSAAFLGDLAIRSIVDVETDKTGAVLYDIKDYVPTWGSFISYITSILPAGGARIRNGRIETLPFASGSGRAAGVVGYSSVCPDALVVSRYWKPDSFDGLARAGGLPRPLVRLMASAMTNTGIGKLLMKLPMEKWLAFDPAKDAKSSVTVFAETCASKDACRRRSLRGESIYALTGRILAGTALAMKEKDPRPVGVRAASEMFLSFERALELTGVLQVD